MSPSNRAFGGRMIDINPTLDQFLNAHKNAIQNIDGNLDDCIVSLLDANRKLVFVWFEAGKYVRHQIK